MSSQTRKIRREDPVETVKPVVNYKPTVSDLYWIRYIQEGKLFFSTMLHNLNFMFDRETTIKHFDIQPAGYGVDVDELKEVYGNEIQKELIPWIKKEYEEKRLTNYIYWKTFRGAEYHDIYLGYRKMFQYNQCLYQLALSSYCGNCIYCKRGENRTHFELVYYNTIKGAEERWSNLIQPDMMLSAEYWKSEK